jgi:Protein of unknown function (DUF3060)
VNGTGNKIRVEQVDEVRVLGANNEIIYDRGVSSAKPQKVKILGAGSSVVPSERGTKNEEPPAKTEPSRHERSHGELARLGTGNF